MDKRSWETSLRSATTLPCSTPEGVKLMNHQFHIAVVFVRWHETEIAARFEDNDAYHQGFRQIEGAYWVSRRA
jgi:hypothetical protein